MLGDVPREAVEVYQDIGLVPEENAVYGRYTAAEFVTLAAKLSGVGNPAERARASLEHVDLTADADRSLGGFSKGMRQRAKVAAALVHDPDILVLDEPLNGTDPVQRAHLITLFRGLADRGKTVIVSSHVLQEVAAQVLKGYGPRADALCVGMAGADRDVETRAMQRILKSIRVAEVNVVTNDALIALVAGCGERYGVTLIVGTGATAYGINRRRVWRQ